MAAKVAKRVMRGTHRGAPRLSKSRFVAGLQCEKQLWWRVHDSSAPELVPDDAQERIFARGHRVGAVARQHVPGGVLIDLPHVDIDGRVAATANAIAGGARVVYEASFLAGGVFVSVDILERRGNRFVLSEVKSTVEVKEHHLPDVAIQLHVVRSAGLDVHRAEVMHLNRECRYPDLSNLFVRVPVTRQLAPLLRLIPDQIAMFGGVVAGPLPEVATGPHCTTPYECPFLARCWPEPPPHHVSTLYRVGAKRLAQLAASGYETIDALPDDAAGSAVALRQIRSIRTGKLVVERGLRRALTALRPPLAFLDFETVSPAIPVWPGCGPYTAVPVQLSCHRVTPAGVEHVAWLAEGSGDPRRACAEALLAACRGMKVIVAFNATFEKRCIATLVQALPDLADELEALSARVEDLLPIIRDHVYHPDFGGSFSLKSMLPALVPELGYDDLEIQDGDKASTALETVLLDADALDDAERRAIREALLRYCERDTLGLVCLHERLEQMALKATR